ncbi:MAG: hypothetical protein KJ579_02620 [Verrucomicrobia bacterium]|nr:hypothetical protein [Verrucomicrobiota bacterium]
MAEEKSNGTNGNGGAAPLPPKIRLNLAQTGAKKPDTSRIDLAAAEPAAIDTNGSSEALNVRDVIDSGPQTTVRPPAEALAKSQTSRISIHDSQPVAPGEAIPVAKSSTSKVSTGTIRASGQPVADVVANAALGRTARIMIDGPGEALPTGGSLGDTGKMTLPADLAAAAAPAPKTVRLQRPMASPKTVVLRRPQAAPQPVMSPPTQGPQTVQMNKPGEGGSGLGEKGATARISVPEGTLESAPPTQRKTIRIKRGGEGPSTGAKTLVLHRPTATGEDGAPAGSPLSGAVAEAELGRALGVEESVEPGVGYAIVAILTFFVVGTLVYALLAQTFLPNLPMPGPMA